MTITQLLPPVSTFVSSHYVIYKQHHPGAYRNSWEVHIPLPRYVAIQGHLGNRHGPGDYKTIYITVITYLICFHCPDVYLLRWHFTLRRKIRSQWGICILAWPYLLLVIGALCPSLRTGEVIPGTGTFVDRSSRALRIAVTYPDRDDGVGGRV